MFTRILSVSGLSLALLVAACSPAEEAETDIAGSGEADLTAETGQPETGDGEAAAPEELLDEVTQQAPLEAGEGEPPLGEDAFVYEAGLDLFGYYYPPQTRRFGEWEMHHLFVGRPMDFEAFEAGGRQDGEAPVWVEFWHTDSEMRTNEMGQEYAVDSRRVRADRFVVQAGRFEFEGHDPDVGHVLISGVIDLEDLPPGGESAFTGGMEVDGDRTRNLSLTRTEGD